MKNILKEIEDQRMLLEIEIRNNSNLIDDKIIIQSQRLDAVINEYMRQIKKFSLF